ncbi:MAG: MBL fold metallo-hydrolase [Methylococcaceae bacterium]|jgi:phosphoribosyl 1,2-cyclic phosphodiesterase
MRFKFWGVRGSIATPGASTVKYGGNTTCIEIRTDDNDLIILDAGTGIHTLAQSLLKELPIIAHIFITHTHWDHIQGLPFFIPIFIPGNHINIYGGQDPVTHENINRALSIQLQYSYFPIREAQLNARITHHTILPGEPIHIGKACITPIVLNHPVLNFGYRIDCDGQSLFFTGDYEPQSNIYDPEDQEFAEFEAHIASVRLAVIAAMQGADALIIDSPYTDAEYAHKKGWGHGNYSASIKLAQAAQVKKLYITHHEPTRSDTELDAIYQNLMQQNPNLDFKLLFAQEGVEISL